MKIIKTINGLDLLKLDKPVLGGYYAIINRGKTTIIDGLCLDAAIDILNNL